MSVHSVDHMDPIPDDGYRGYDIDHDGQVVEFYDHTNESSVLGGASGLSASRRLLAEERKPPPQQVHHEPPPQRRRKRRRDAGCCSSCVDCLITIGRLPVPSAICLIMIWAGTGMFIGAGWAVLDETQSLFQRYGPVDGNPATDDPPEWYLIGGLSSNSDQRYELRNPEDLGNRVPETFLSLKRAFCGIIPFVFIFSIVITVDGSISSREIYSDSRGCKSTSAGICCSISLLFIAYMLLLSWVFFLAFTTLGVYYYRMVMLRCEDLTQRGYTEGVQKDICLDLVQYGLIMFKSTLDEHRGKICGPGDPSRRTVGDLDEYCSNYHHAWRLILICFAGCLLNIIAMMNALIILTGNYSNLQRKYRRSFRDGATTVASRSPALTHRTVASSHQSGPPPFVVGTTNGVSSEKFRLESRRRHSDIELDYIGVDNDRSTSVSYHPQPPRRFQQDSHVGVDYYYKRY